MIAQVNTLSAGAHGADLSTPLGVLQSRAGSSQGPDQPEITGFRVALANFEGPFDLLLQLISAKKMDITDVALAEVTDEFLSYTNTLDPTSDLEEVTEFLVVAATLLDLKTARLLPRGDVDSEEDIELLEMRDLLFARLMQYQAYKKVAEFFSEQHKQAHRRYPRAVGMEEQFAHLLPPVTLGYTPESFAELAASVFRPRPPEHVDTEHLHEVSVSVPHQAGIILSVLKDVGVNMWMSFTALTRDCTLSMDIVGRFLALLELYKAQAVDTHQDQPLEGLEVRWTGLDVDPAVVAASQWD